MKTFTEFLKQNVITEGVEYTFNKHAGFICWI